MNPVDSARSALRNILNVLPGEKALVLYDTEQKHLGEVFSMAAVNEGLWAKAVHLETGEHIRETIPDTVKEMMVASKPDICVNIFRQKDEETSLRGSFVKVQRALKMRVGHCPGLTESMLTEGALALTDEEYKEMFEFGEKLKRALKGAESVHVTSPDGADFMLSTKGRSFVAEKTNLPCGEIMCIPPVGDSFTGKLVCTSGGAGRLYKDTPVTIHAENGLAGKIECMDPEVKARVKAELDRDAGARYLGEMAFGINPKARLVDQFLEAEKVIGTIHVAFGGSEYPTRTHIDLLVENPTVVVTINGDKKTVMEKGEFKFHKK